MKKIIIALCIILSAWIIHRTEFIYGVCLDEQGNGKIFTNDIYYNYISYSKVPNVKAHDIILTIDLLNPLNNECDDILFRWDFIL